MASELTSANSPNAHEISRDELRDRLRDPSLTIVDVLPQASYVEAHIPRAGCFPPSPPTSPFTAVNSRELALGRRSPRCVSLFTRRFAIIAAASPIGSRRANQPKK